MMTAISDKIKSVDQVFIVGHRNLDMDALGASVGMQFFSSNILASSYVVYDPHAMASDISRAIAKLERRAGNENPSPRGSHANGDGSLFVNYG